jgi:ADP-heptose:LPS heptosyltransferase
MMPTSSVQALIPGVKKIAVLRANGIGDFVCALPALDALRAAYPHAEIVVLGKRWHRAFLAGRPGPVDRALEVPFCSGVNEDSGAPHGAAVLDTFFESMRGERFDLALQLHGGGRNSNPFVLRLGARVTAGLRTPDAAVLDRWLPYIFFQSEVLRHLEVVSLVGAEPVTLTPHMRVTTADVEESLRVVPEDDKPLIALHPCATDVRRWWPAECFARIGDLLAAEGARVLVLGTATERQQVERVVTGMRSEAVNLCDRLSLGGLLGLLSRCRVVVSNDSGPSHLAEAVGTPTVAIYWCVNVVNWAPLTRATQRPLISWRRACPVCGRDAVVDPCQHTASLVEDVPVDDVWAAARDLYAISQDSRWAQAQEQLAGARFE